VNPLRSGFLLSQDVDGGSPERFAAEDFTGLTCQADLVVLSACESGITRRGPGDELVGLTRAIIYSGAASLVVSLWSVDEISTSILMQRFYKGLLGGEGKVLALQHAQVALRDMTLAQVVSHCEALRPQQQGKGGRLLDLDLANLAYRAGDFAKALAEYEKLRARANLTEAERTGLTAAITRCRRALRHGRLPDYGAHPFADAYYWAPFVLVGDWR
jgi:CHAT domain-containing protein